ncbi:MAG: YdiU family protein [Hyphomonas sp.]|uniref:protein adenylyltransferase SelO family protein n=1 Tax=Hyphomonas sp. TaxID=87 RepID=UPI0017DCBD9F|nr:YdiU family protein [Hyphomonas sp.]MBA3067381.1 YdiU family protein [Hyphomonas sp.]MBU3922053.1 YdiU family protein [Alphaproteobacteria bacterium]MBU4061068.1 YdiU family protein [Alphaproteobacteria bacterium]MBU4165924.1 YdiU family protein [Alphaproteobacteria bacterium]
MPPFLKLAGKFADPVTSANFPHPVLRWRNPRWADAVGLGNLTDAAWLEHFARFTPLPGNLPQPLAMRYHGHQFGTYNPDLGDGRGFLFAQVRDPAGRLLDLGTKGSGQTPWSRGGDGRLTLKGGVREILAATYLEALGVNTSKAFSLVETGESLQRNDEPSPARGSVLVRLSHSHVRFGTFQRCAFLDDREAMAELVDYCIAGFHPGADDPDMARKACALLEQVALATGRMIGQWMAAGFVHGVMNTDNFNITGETFDFGPWRFLPRSDPNFTAAYFDQNGLYRFGRQPLQGGWALQQLASALVLLADAGDLARALAPYEAAYRDSFTGHTHALLGLAPTGDRAADTAFLQAFYGWMTDSGAGWAQTFFDWFAGAASAQRAAASPQAALYAHPAFEPVRAALMARAPVRAERLALPYFQRAAPVSLVIEEVESLWAPIAERDDWSAFTATTGHIDEARRALAL